jgi:hypothetical protein
LPSIFQNECEQNLRTLVSDSDGDRMHIGGLNYQKNLVQNKIESSETMNDGILKEINKNTSAEHFKVSKKHKFGHGAKKSEGNVLCGML